MATELCNAYLSETVSSLARILRRKYYEFALNENPEWDLRCYFNCLTADVTYLHEPVHDEFTIKAELSVKFDVPQCCIQLLPNRRYSIIHFVTPFLDDLSDDQCAICYDQPGDGKLLDKDTSLLCEDCEPDAQCVACWRYVDGVGVQCVECMELSDGSRRWAVFHT